LKQTVVDVWIVQWTGKEFHKRGPVAAKDVA